jgi:hypothetical protein
MNLKRKTILPLALLFVFTVLFIGESLTYEEFFDNYLEKKVKLLNKDVTDLGQLVDSWRNGKMTRTEATARVEVIESRAESYTTGMLKLIPPEGEFEYYRQSVGNFFTWVNVVGLYREGITEESRTKLEAASVLMKYYREKLSLDK